MRGHHATPKRPIEMSVSYKEMNRSKFTPSEQGVSAKHSVQPKLLLIFSVSRDTCARDALSRRHCRLASGDRFLRHVPSKLQGFELLPWLVNIQLRGAGRRLGDVIASAAKQSQRLERRLPSRGTRDYAPRNDSLPGLSPPQN